MVAGENQSGCLGSRSRRKGVFPEAWKGAMSKPLHWDPAGPVRQNCFHTIGGKENGPERREKRSENLGPVWPGERESCYGLRMGRAAHKVGAA